MPIPVTLHRHVMATDDSFAWSKAFARFIGEIIPSGIHQEWREWREWWLDPYIMGRLTARFGESIVTSVIAQVTQVDCKAPSAKDKRARRSVQRAIRGRAGLNPWHDRPEIGRRSYQFPE